MSNWQKTKGAALWALACVCVTSLRISIWNSVVGDVTAAMPTFFVFFHFFKDVKKKFLGAKNYDSHHRFPLEKIVFSQ